MSMNDEWSSRGVRGGRRGALLCLRCRRRRGRDRFMCRATGDRTNNCQNDHENDGIDFHCRRLSNGYASFARSTICPSGFYFLMQMSTAGRAKDVPKLGRAGSAFETTPYSSEC